MKGRAILKSSRELSQFELKIPQPYADDVPIDLRDPTEASEVLGVWSSPSGQDGRHLRHMMEKGRKWASRVMASSLTPAEVWQSFKRCRLEVPWTTHFRNGILPSCRLWALTGISHMNGELSLLPFRGWACLI